MKQLWPVCLGLGSLVAGCGSPQDAVVAQVGQHQITAASLRAFVEQLPVGLRSQQTGEAARQHYLQALIDRRLLLMEARGRGLDTTAAVREAVREAVDARARTLYRAREILPKAKVPEEEVRRYFSAEGFDRERRLNAILVKTREEIDAVLKELRAGRSFAEVARAHSLDERSAKQGGELGFIGRDMALRLYIPLEVFASLPTGQVSQPLQASKSWHVVRFTEDRTASYEKNRSYLEARLSEERARQVEEEHCELLGESFQARLDPAGLREIAGAYRQEDPTPLAASSTPLYRYDQGTLEIAEAQETLRRLRIFLGLADSAQAVSILKRFVLNPFLLKEAARRAGLYEAPEILQLEKRAQENVLLEAVRKTAITQHLSTSEEEVRHYYDNRPEVFHHEEAVWVEELLLPSAAEAQQAKELIEAGALFAELAERSLRPGTKESRARFHFHPREKDHYPKLVPALLGASRGELVGPLEVEGGYSVFRVVGREPGGLEPYETAQQRARALLEREWEEQELETLVKQLREKYASQVQVQTSHLAEALPDSLLNRQGSPSQGPKAEARPPQG
ncbi:MAG: peptidyl-prolyl cis-trans isomerase [Candidatus Latescibacteria bacterium]|nr:peptidyl-prolyl cis-trans isomerase [Candidatus Latescibacterota bacterium]